MPKPIKEKDQDQDESRFNDTLKRMLKTPPKPHEKSATPKPPTSQPPKLDSAKRK